MAESLSQNARKSTPISTTGPYKKITSPIYISLSASSLIFFIISFALLSISLLSLSSEHSIFWFFLSNSIIFFIAAADYNYSKRDYYNEYLAYNTSPRTAYCTLESPDPASHHSEGSKESEEKSEPLYDNEKASSLKCRRSRSEEAVECEKMLRRSKTGNGERCSLEAGDLSTMSDEELNWRIEEFIRRFNREILLQQMRESEEKEI